MENETRFELWSKTRRNRPVVAVAQRSASGDLYVGGAAAVGRGAVKGTASVRFENGKKAEISAKLEISGEARELFPQKIAEFHEEVRYEPA